MKEMLLKAILPLITKIVLDMMTPKNFKKHGSKLFGMLREYVKDTETKWDDEIVLPVLDASEEMLGWK